MRTRRPDQRGGDVTPEYFSPGVKVSGECPFGEDSVLGTVLRSNLVANGEGIWSSVIFIYSAIAILKHKNL